MEAPFRSIEGEGRIGEVWYNTPNGDLGNGLLHAQSHDIAAAATVEARLDWEGSNDRVS